MRMIAETHMARARCDDAPYGAMTAAAAGLREWI
jgi:hypothetical protein